MNVELLIPQLYDVKYIKADLGVRYWEDTLVNGVKDNFEHPTIPCTIDAPYRRIGGDKRWCILIDIETGKIINWENGKTADVHYKVCDDGTYTLLDHDSNKIVEFEGYVPSIFAINDSGYGDYVIMKINEEGYIQDWKCTSADIEEAFNNRF